MTDHQAHRTIRNQDTGQVVLARARWCASYWCRLRGLMFRPPPPEGEGLLFVYGRESRTETSIHMLFVSFPIAVVWLDRDGRVVDKLLAKPWRPAYASRAPAQYFIEALPSLLDRVQTGDRLDFSQ